MPQVDIRQIDVTFRGEEASTMFIEPVYMDDDLRQNFRVIPNVVSKKKLAFAQELEKIVRRYSDSTMAPPPSSSNSAKSPSSAVNFSSLRRKDRARSGNGAICA